MLSNYIGNYSLVLGLLISVLLCVLSIKDFNSGGKKIKRIAIAGGKTNISSCMPCGGCRQRIFEFANKDTVIITMNEDNEWEKKKN